MGQKTDHVRANRVKYTTTRFYLASERTFGYTRLSKFVEERSDEDHGISSVDPILMSPSSYVYCPLCIFYTQSKDISINISIRVEKRTTKPTYKAPMDLKNFPLNVITLGHFPFEKYEKL